MSCVRYILYEIFDSKQIIDGGETMKEHPISDLMTTAMHSIKDMVDVNTIVGDAVQTGEGTVIIPISKVSFGFAAGGGEYYFQNPDEKEKYSREDAASPTEFPFAGGSGAGISIQPVAFMVVGKDQVKLLPVNVNSSFEKMLDLVPEVMNKFNGNTKRRFKQSDIQDPLDD